MKKLITLGITSLFSVGVLAADGSVSNQGGHRICILDGNSSGALCSLSHVSCSEDGTCSYGGQSGTVIDITADRKRMNEVNNEKLEFPLVEKQK